MFTKNKPLTKSQSVALCGLMVALLAVSAWLAIPLGPVPITLQVFILIIIVLAFPTKEALIAIAAYILLGALGVPVFSGMRGGIAMIAGPTGGFIWGFLAAALLVLVIRGFLPQAKTKLIAIAQWIGLACIFLSIVYFCGWLQLMNVAKLAPLAAFSVAVAPFVVIDLIKAALAIGILSALPKRFSRRSLA